ncbi:MAG: uracil-DNA glycosylase [Thermosynechococcaceae cyanobacterium MS004]|nr:uracil-DNA glycosylase [Thermosynechococcaceae cyanobacterium MS004]
MAPEEQISLFGSLEPSISPASSAVPAHFDPALIPTSAKVPIPVGTYGSIDEMVPHCTTCHRCELGQSRINSVIGRGNPQAPILVIGEGPGQNEDETGLPFVGRAGQLLEKILASVKLSAEQDVYLCNIVKCRPPGNRTPTADESDACKPYVLEQIRLVNPKIILLTGATAVRGLTGDKRGITKIRGQWIDWQGYLCMPILHPAYLLRNPSKEPNSPKWLMWQDIKAIRVKLDELTA